MLTHSDMSDSIALFVVTMTMRLGVCLCMMTWFHVRCIELVNHRQKRNRVGGQFLIAARAAGEDATAIHHDRLGVLRQRLVHDRAFSLRGSQVGLNGSPMVCIH